MVEVSTLLPACSHILSHVVIFYPMFSLILFSSFCWGETEICLYVHVDIQERWVIGKQKKLKLFADTQRHGNKIQVKLIKTQEVVFLLSFFPLL